MFISSKEKRKKKALLESYLIGREIHPMILSWRPGNLIILSCAPLPSKPKMQERRCKYADNSSKLSAFFEKSIQRRRYA